VFWTFLVCLAIFALVLFCIIVPYFTSVIVRACRPPARA
jgi:hypothetical protein